MLFCRFCCEKSPEAIRILLPDETSPAVRSAKITVLEGYSSCHKIIAKTRKTKFDRFLFV